MILFIQLRNKSNLKFTCHNLKCTIVHVWRKKKTEEEKSRTRNTDEICWMPVGAMCLVPPSSLSFLYFFFIYTKKLFKSRYVLLYVYYAFEKTWDDMNNVAKVYICNDVPVCCVWMILNATVYYCDPCFLGVLHTVRICQEIPFMCVFTVYNFLGSCYVILRLRILNILHQIFFFRWSIYINVRRLHFVLWILLI